MSRYRWDPVVTGGQPTLARNLGLGAVAGVLLVLGALTFGPPLVRYLRMRRM